MSNPTQGTQGFETYVNWWDSNWKNMVDTMPMQNGMTIDIAFDNWGQPLDPTNEAMIVAIAKEIQSRAQQQGVLVNLKLSFGGATYAMPNLQNSQDALKLASSLTGILSYFQSKYGIDFAGVDLDVESTGNSSQYSAQFIEDLRSDLDALGGSHKKNRPYPR